MRIDERPWWSSHTDKERVPAEPVEHDRSTEGLRNADVVRDADVVIVGAGIVGLHCALELATSGARVLVLEGATRLGQGISGRSTAKVTTATGTLPARIRRLHGDAVAAEYMRAGIEGFDAIHRAEPHLARGEHLLWAASRDGFDLLQEQDDWWQRSMRDHTGHPVSVPFIGPSTIALAYQRLLLVQPVEHLRRLAADIIRAGGAVSLGRRVEGVVADGRRWRVNLASNDAQEHTVKADVIVMATHAPIIDRPPTWLRWQQWRHDAVVVRGREHPTTYCIDDGWSTRRIDEQHTLVVGPATHVGTRRETHHSGETHRWATEHLGGTVVARWSAQDIYPDDLLPMVGAVHGEPPLVLATGFSGWGLAHGAAAGAECARIVLQQQRRYPSWELGWSRLRQNESSTILRLFGTGVDVARRHVADGLRPSVALTPGQGVVRRIGTEYVAECHTRDGEVHALNARCPHRGCLVAWNATDQSWDCPCHGSRFSPNGEVIEAPAATGLSPTLIHQDRPRDSA